MKITQFLILCTTLFAAINNGAMASNMSFNGGAAAELAWQAAAGTTALEGFESYSAGAQIPSLPALGISFDLLAGGGFPVIYQHWADGSMQLANFPNGINEINRWNDIVLHVLPGYNITAFGFWNGDGQQATLVGTAYDASGNVLGSVDAYTGTFGGFISDVSISRVVFGGNVGDGWNHLDRLQTNAVASVPIPAAAWLMVSGLLGLIGVARHKASK